MVFNFIKYTRPAWQFNVIPNIHHRIASCYITEEHCNEEIKDRRYETRSAQLADIGYQLWNRGFLLEASHEEMLLQQHLQKPTLKDEYIFIRKYWGSGWTGFALFLRLFTFKNPFAELKACWQTRHIARVDPYQQPRVYENYESFNSALVDSCPAVAVIIPTLNRYEYLKDVLSDLEKQGYKNFEVIIIDQSDIFNKSFYEQFNLCIKAVHQKEKLLWTARNKAIKLTAAEYLLFFDDDSRVDADWITEHLKCLDFFKADISAGVSLAAVGQKISASYNYFRWADQFDSGNAMVKRHVFSKTGLFDEQFNGQRMGDAEFGFRAYMHGIKSISNHKAFRVHLKVGTGGLREMGSWDGFRPTKWFAPKPVPSVLYLYKKYLPRPLYRNAVLIGIMLSNVSYKHKRSSKMLMISVLLTIVKSPLLLIQYSRSLAIAKQMLNNNYQPEALNE